MSESNGHGRTATGDAFSLRGEAILNSLMAQLQGNASPMTLSRDALRRMLDPRRNVYDEAGYPRGNLVSDQYYADLYAREAIAARVVEVFPKESWQVQPTVYESEDPEDVTPFERAWDQLGRQLRGEKSYYKEEEGNPVWDYLLRADVLSGIGQYGIILLGLDDGMASMAEPVKGFEEEGSVEVDVEYEDQTVLDDDGKELGKARRPRAKPTANQLARVKNPPRYALNIDKSDDDPDDPDGGGTTDGKRKLLYLRAFPQHLAEISRFEANRSSPRHGRPVMYRVTLNDPSEGHWSGAGFDSTTIDVHWSRVIHVADLNHTASPSEVFAVERMRPVLNQILGLQKLYCGSPEMFWKGAFPGLVLKTDPALGGDVKYDRDRLKDSYENFINGLQRVLALNGFDATMLAPAVADPTPQILAQLEAVCIKLGVPKRVFMGSERGELASSQDDAAWNDRLRERQRNYVTPRIIVPFVDRLIQCGVLPEPKYRPKVETPNLPGAIDPETGEPLTDPFSPAKKTGGKAKSVPGGFDPAEEEATPAGPERGLRKPVPAVNAFGDDDDEDQGPAAGRGVVVPVEGQEGEEPAAEAGEEDAEDGPPPGPGEVDTDQEPGYAVEWPDLTSQTQSEKAEVASKKVQALAAAIAGDLQSMVTPADILSKFLGFDEDEAVAMLEAGQVHATQKAADDMAQQQAEIEAGLRMDPVEEQELKIEAMKEGGGPIPPKPPGGGGGGFNKPPFPPKPSNNVENYDPSQPRDADGKWTGGRFAGTLYHGTKARSVPKKLFPGEYGMRKDAGNLGSGVYLTPDEDVATFYAAYDKAKVLKVAVDLKNPLVLIGRKNDQAQAAAERLGVSVKPTYDGNIQTDHEWSREFTEKARAAGHDGVIWIDSKGRMTEVVSFDPVPIGNADVVHDFTEASLNADATENVFCPTGEGGGVDPTCGKDGGKGSDNRLLDESQNRVKLDKFMPVDEKANEEILDRDDGSYRGRKGNIKLTDLTATQETVDPKKVNFFIKNPGVDGDDEILIWEMDGKRYIGDGHHRITAALRRGESEIWGRYIVMRAKEPAGNVFCPTGDGGGVDPTCGKDGGKGSSGTPSSLPGKSDGTGGDTSGSVDPKNKPGERHRVVGKGRTHEGVPEEIAKNMTTEQARDAVKWHDGMTQVGKNAPSPYLKDEATRPALNDSERGALQKYSYLNDGPLNARKRGYGKTDSPYNDKFFQEMDTQLESAFDKAGVMKKPVPVVRGMKMDPARAEKFVGDMEAALKGDGTVSMPGYTSTAVPGGFAHKMGLKKAEAFIPEPFRGNVVVKINAVHGLDMGPHSQLPGEGELLLDHRSKYKVKAVTRNKDGTTTVEFDQLPPDRTTRNNSWPSPKPLPPTPKTPRAETIKPLPSSTRNTPKPPPSGPTTAGRSPRPSASPKATSTKKGKNPPKPKKPKGE